MKREGTRNLGFDLSRLHAKFASTFNAALLDLIVCKDAIVRTGAAKLIFQIVIHHFETGKLMQKAKRTESKAKIQIVTQSPTSAHLIHAEQALLIQQLAYTLLDDLYANTRMQTPTLAGAIFADAVALLLQMMCGILNDSAILMDADPQKREELEAQQEVLVQKVKKMAVGFVTQLLAWYAASRPLYTQMLKEILLLLETNGGELVLDVGSVAFGEMLEMPILEVGLDAIPVSNRVEHLKSILKEKPGKEEYEQRLSDGLWKLVGLISKPPLALRSKFLVGHCEDIMSCMCSILVLPGVARGVKQLAAETMRFVEGVAPVDPKATKQVDDWFLQALSSVNISKEAPGLWQTVMDVYLRMDRKKEVQVSLLNELLTAWNKGETRLKQAHTTLVDSPTISANFKTVLVYILQHPEAAPNLYSLLNSYVQKNAAIPKIQKLVEESVQADDLLKELSS